MPESRRRRRSSSSRRALNGAVPFDFFWGSSSPPCSIVVLIIHTFYTLLLIRVLLLSCARDTLPPFRLPLCRFSCGLRENWGKLILMQTNDKLIKQFLKEQQQKERDRRVSVGIFKRYVPKKMLKTR